MTKQEEDRVCCDLLIANLKSMEAILKSMKIVTSQMNHLEMIDGINDIQRDLVGLFEQVETVQEISQGVWGVVKDDNIQ